MAEEDCYYGVGDALGGEGPATIVRFDANGVPEWRIPVTAVSGDRLEYHPLTAPQLVAVGRRLVLIVPPPDRRSASPSEDPESPPEQILLIDPLTAEVIYSGNSEPHETPPPPSFTQANLERLWDELSTADEAAADEAMWRLASAGDAAVEFIRAKLPGDMNMVRRERAVHVVSRVGTPAAARYQRDLVGPAADTN